MRTILVKKGERLIIPFLRLGLSYFRVPKKTSLGTYINGLKIGFYSLMLPVVNVGLKKFFKH